jgi:hypothetical protein
MSQPNQYPEQSQQTDRPQEYGLQQIELERGKEEQTQLRWLVIENPDQSIVLNEDDYILDSYFNPQFDIWEVLIRLEPEEEEESEE